MERQYIKGEYCFSINISTMFAQYNLELKEHNLITSNGIRFFLHKAVTNPTVVETTDDETNYSLEDEYGVIGFVGIGTSNEEPTTSDTHLTNETIFYDTRVGVEDNKIILTLNTTGATIDGTTEIGVYTTKNTLISRDVHTEYVVPSTATVKLEYTFTLNQDSSQEEEEEENND